MATARVVPVKSDKRYRSWTQSTEPYANAVVVYMMDVSGSMTDEQKEIVRTEAFWIDTWLKRSDAGGNCDHRYGYVARHDAWQGTFHSRDDDNRRRQA